MAWRPSDYVKRGYLDNRVLGRTKGEIEFAGLGKVVLSLKGDMEEPFFGKKISFEHHDWKPDEAREYMQGFSRRQTGEVELITELEYRKRPYLNISWFSNQNDRCVVELFDYTLRIIGKNYKK